MEVWGLQPETTLDPQTRDTKVPCKYVKVKCLGLSGFQRLRGKSVTV